jgi:hypothetical protein
MWLHGAPGVTRWRQVVAIYTGAEMPKDCSISEEQALALLAHLVSSADICRFEPHFYGTFRLVDAASRLIASLLENGCEDAWLRDFHADIERKKTWMMWDREAYFAFLPDAARELAVELKRRQEAIEPQ